VNLRDEKLALTHPFAKHGLAAGAAEAET